MCRVSFQGDACITLFVCLFVFTYKSPPPLRATPSHPGCRFYHLAARQGHFVPTPNLQIVGFRGQVSIASSQTRVHFTIRDQIKVWLDTESGFGLFPGTVKTLLCTKLFFLDTVKIWICGYDWCR